MSQTSLRWIQKRDLFGSLYPFVVHGDKKGAVDIMVNALTKPIFAVARTQHCTAPHLL